MTKIMLAQIEQKQNIDPTFMFWIVLGILILIFLVMFITSCKKVSEISDNNDPMNNSDRYLFKHPCGSIVSTGNDPIEFNYTDAKDFAKKHPYYYTRRFSDTTWRFAGECFNEPKTI